MKNESREISCKECGKKVKVRNYGKLNKSKKEIRNNQQFDDNNYICGACLAKRKENKDVF